MKEISRYCASVLGVVWDLAQELGVYKVTRCDAEIFSLKNSLVKIQIVSGRFSPSPVVYKVSLTMYTPFYSLGGKVNESSFAAAVCENRSNDYSK